MSRRARLLSLAVVSAATVGCAFTVGGGGEGSGSPSPASSVTVTATVTTTATATVTATSTVTATVTATATVTVTPSPAPTALGAVEVFALKRPRGEPCVGATVYASYGEQILDTGVTDAFGHVTLMVTATGSDIAVVPSNYHATAKLGIRAGDDVIVPVFASCGDVPLVFNAAISVDGALADYDAEAWFGGLGTSIPFAVAGTSTVINVSEDIGLRSSQDSVSLYILARHTDNSSIPPTVTYQEGAAFGIPLDAPDVAIQLRPTSLSTLSISAVNASGAVSNMTAGAGAVRGGDLLSAMTQGAVMTNGAGSWQADLEIPGAPFADHVAAYVGFTTNTGGGYAFVRSVQTDLSTATLDCSVLPPQPVSAAMFDGTALSWSITTPGTATAAISAIMFTDAGGNPHFFDVIFPPNICAIGACRLPLPPMMRRGLPPGAPPVASSLYYVWRPGLAGYADAAAFFLAPQYPEGVTRSTCDECLGY